MIVSALEFRRCAAFSVIAALAASGCGARSSLEEVRPISRAEPDAGVVACPARSSQLAWNRAFDGDSGGVNSGGAVAVDAEGAVLLVGTGVLARPECLSPGQTRGDGTIGFLAKLDPQGNVVWQWRIGQNDGFYGIGVASDGAGGAMFVVTIEEGTDLGAGPVPGGKYAGRVDAGGAPVFFRRLIGRSAMLAFAASPAHGIVAVFRCSTDEPEGAPGACGDAPQGSAAVVRLAPDGAVLGKELIAVGVGPQEQLMFPSGATFTASGGVVVGGGIYSSIVKYANGESDTPTGNETTFVARYDAGGVLVAHRLLATGGQSIFLAPEAMTDAVFVGGEAIGAADLGGGTLETGTFANGFLGKLGPGLEHVWSLGLSSPKPLLPLGLRADESGVVLHGNANGAIHAGGLVATPPPSAPAAGFIAAVASDGTPTLLRVFPGAASINDVALGAGGMKIMTGGFFESVDFGVGPLIEPKPLQGEGYVVQAPLW